MTYPIARHAMPHVLSYVLLLVLTLGVVAAGTAHAQSTNMTVYGYLDMGIVSETGKGSVLSRGNNNWLGFKGREDLGDGLSAIFNVQMRFNPDTGEQEKSSTRFQGETTVGLSSIVGSVRLGRALTPLWAQKYIYDPWYDSAFMGSMSTYNGNFNSDGLPTVDFSDYSRIDNAVYYDSTAIAGLSAHAEVELQLATGARRRSRGLSLNYAQGPATAMLAVEHNRVADRIAYVGGSWRFSALSVLGAYSRTSLTGTERAQTSTLVAVTHPIGADTVRFAYGRIKESRSQKLSLGYNHALSKRTNLYADLYREERITNMHGVAVGMNHTF